MKLKSFLFVLTCLISISAMAQLPTNRNYPSNAQYTTRLNTQSYAVSTPTYYHGSGSNAVAGKDTLIGVDTVECYWNWDGPYNTKYVICVTPTTSTISGTIYFYASENGVDWENVTGITTVCTSCIGASKTLTSVSAATRYTLDFGNTNFPYVKAVVANSNSGGAAAITALGIFCGTGN